MTFEVIQDANGDEMERGEPDPVSEPVERKSEQYIRQSEDAARRISEMPNWMQHNLTPPTDPVSEPVDGLREAAQRLIDYLDVREHHEDDTGIRRVHAASRPYVSDLRTALAAAPAEDRACTCNGPYKASKHASWCARQSGDPR